MAEAVAREATEGLDEPAAAATVAAEDLNKALEGLMAAQLLRALLRQQNLQAMHKVIRYKIELPPFACPGSALS